jgi:hypothetical protein
VTGVFEHGIISSQLDLHSANINSEVGELAGKAGGAFQD